MRFTMEIEAGKDFLSLLVLLERVIQNLVISGLIKLALDVKIA